MKGKVIREALGDYVIVSAAAEAAVRLADALEEAIGARLPIVTPEAFHGERGIFVGCRRFQNYGGYRCALTVEPDRIYLDGGTEELFGKAQQMFLSALEADGVPCGSRYAYLWQKDELQNGLKLRSEQRRWLCSGVSYLHRSYIREDGKPVETHTVVADKDAPARAAVWGSPQGQSQTVPEHIAQMQSRGKDVVAAVNADFFHFFHDGDKTTFGIQIIDGVVYKEPSNVERYGDHWFGVTDDGKYVMSDLDGYRDRYKGGLRQAVGGGVWLMRDWEVCIPPSPALEPRTAVATTADGGLVLLCVDGRSEGSVGATYADLLQVFLDLDAEVQTVLNLDGGHSTILMGKQEDGQMAILNSPSSGLEDLRPIADVLTLVMEKSEPLPAGCGPAAPSV